MTDKPEHTHSFEKFFASHAEPELTAPAEVWFGLSASLDEMRKKKKRKKIMFWITLSSAASIILLTGILFFTKSTNSKSDENGHLTGQHKKTNSVGSVPDALTGKSAHQGSVLDEKQIRPVKLKSLTYSKYQNKIDENQSDKTIRQNQLPFESTDDLKQPSDDKKVQFSLSEQNPMITALQISSLQDPKHLIKSINQEINIPSKLSCSPILPIPRTPNAIYPNVKINPVEMPTYFTLSLYAGLGRRNNMVSMNGQENQLWTNKFSETKPRSKIFSAGFLFQYHFNPYITVGSGVGFTSWKYRSKEFHKFIIRSNSDYEFDSPTGRMVAPSEDLETFYDQSVSGSDTLLFKLQFAKSVRYMSIPLNVKLSPGFKIVNPYIQLGLSTNILIGTQNDLSFIRSGISREVQNNNSNGLKPVYLSFRPSLGIDFRASKNFSFFFQGQGDFPLQNFYTPASGFVEWKSREISLIFGTNINF